MKDEVKIKISIDNQTAELKNIKNEFSNLSSNIDKSSQKTEKFQDRIKAMGHIGAGIIGLNVSISALNSTVSDFVKKADEMKSVQNRLKLVTSSTAELATIQTELFKISQNSMVLYTDTADLYSRMTRSTKELNLSQAELLNVTDTISKTLIISGGSAESANAALEQLGQGFASGTLRGEELNSVMEQTPRLAQAIADGMGITVGQLRELGANGELTAQKIIEALKGQASIIGSEFSKMSITAEQGFTRVRNSTSLMISKLDESLGVTSNIAKSFSYASENVDNYINSLSPEQIQNTTEYIKNMGIAVVGSYTAIKTAQGIYSVYNNILESNKKITQQNIEIEQARTKAISLGEQATKARKIADEARNTAQASGLLIAENHYKMLNKEAIALETAAKKQQAYSYQLESTAKGFKVASVGANLLKGALSTIPFMAISVGISAIATSLLTASDNSEILEKTLQSTGEELENLTQNQLNYRKSLVETAIQEQKIAVLKASFKAGSKGLFETNKGQLEDLAKYDEEKQKLAEMQFSYEDLTDALNNYNKQVTTTVQNTSQKPIVRDDSAIIKLMGSELSKFNLELDENIKKLQASGATEAEVDKYRADAIKKFNETRQKANEKLSKDTSKTADEINKAYLDISQIGMSEYDKSLLAITEKTQGWQKAGVSNNDILVAQSKLLDELNQKTSVALAKEDLSYYERLLQLKSDSYEKEIELANISYTQKVLDIDSLNRPIAEKEKLISLETELYNKTLERMQLDRNTEFQDTMSGFYDDMLESQISLNGAVYDFGESFGEAGTKISNATKSLISLTNTELKYKKELGSVNDKYTKQFNKYAGDVTKTKKLEMSYTKEIDELNKANFNNQLSSVGEISGTFKNFFDEQSTGYKVLHSVEQRMHAARMAMMLMELPQTLALTAAKWGEAAAGATASVTSAGAGDPYTAPVRVALMIGLMAAAMTMFGGKRGSSGGGSVSVPSVAEAAQETLDFENKMITDRLDRQIELLEELNLQGSAAKLQVVSAKVQFDYEKATSINDIRKTMEENLGEWQSKDQVSIFNAIHSDLGYKGDIIDYFSSDGPEKIWLNFSEKEHNGLTNWWSTYIDVTDRQFMEMRNEFQNKMSDFAVDVIGTINNLKDTGKDLKETYDELTDSQKYANIDLMEAIKQVDKLRGNRSFANYIEDEIENITKLEKELTADRISLLLSEDIADMRAKVDLINYLSAQTGIAFENGAEDVLNYVDAIDMVSETLVKSRENIKDFEDSFKTEDELLKRQALGLGISVASSAEELFKQFDKLSKDQYGLTDEELNYLETAKDSIIKKNEELLDAQKSSLDAQLDAYNEQLNSISSNISVVENIMKSLDSTIDKFKNTVNGSSYTLEQFYSNMKETQSLSLTKDYDSFKTSLEKTIKYSDSLFEKTNFNSLWDMQFAQVVATNQFENMDLIMESELDYLKQIEENTKNTANGIKAQIDALGNKITDTNDIFKDYFNSTYNNNESIVIEGYKEVLGREADKEGLEYWKNELEIGRLNNSNIKSTMATVAALNGEIDREKYIELFYTLGLGRQADKEGLEYWAKDNTPLVDLYNKMGAVAKLNGEKINSFDVGTAFVPQDQLAKIHKGEIITPPPLSADIRAGNLTLGNNNKLLEENIKLREEIKDMQETLKKMAISLENMDDREEYKMKVGA